MSSVPPLRFPGFTDEWKECTIRDIAKIEKGNGISKDQLSEEGDECILYGELYTKYKSEIIDEVYSKTKVDSTKLMRSQANDVLIPCSGETAEDIATARCVKMEGILLGGDLNIMRFDKQDGAFMSYQLNGKRKYDIARIAQGVSVVHLYPEHLKSIRVVLPELEEQQKIVNLLSLIDERIATQNKIIEDLKKLKSAIIDCHFNGRKANNRLGDLIHEVSNRNKRNTDLPVLSVSNRQGFIAQSEQFENRIIASDDTSNYKIVIKNDFAYNPARINVGSIARLVNYESGIVSPMYICFRCSDEILPEYLELFFQSRYFQLEVEKRLEGSVRLCLSMDGIKSIQFSFFPIYEQKALTEKLKTIQSKLDNEETMNLLYQAQRKYLLTKLFI